jgi:hypothetical protein
MSQITRGLLLSNGVYDLVGNGDPNTRQDLQELFAARVGSTYRRLDGTSGHILYLCTVAGTPATGGSSAVAGTWTAIA